VVEYFYTDTQKIIPMVNSEKTGYVYRSDVTALIKNLENLAKGTDIASIHGAEQ